MPTLVPSIRSAPDRVEVDLALDGEPMGTLWFQRVAGPDAPMSARDPGFLLVALLPLVMNRGWDLRLPSAVEPSLLANADEWQDAWCRVRPDSFRRVHVDAAPARDSWWRRTPSRQPAVLAFSGGLDATYTLAAHVSGHLGIRSRPIGLAVMVHGFDIPQTEVAAFGTAYAAAARITSGFGVPLVAVRTNWREFCPDWEASFMAGLVGVLRLFAHRRSAAIVSSEEPYGMEVPGWGSTTATNPLLGSARFPVITTGLGQGRADKAGLVSRYPDAVASLRVCWAGPMTGANCGECEKCVRTALEFLANGVTEVGGMGTPPLDRVAGLRVNNQTQLNYLVELLGSPGQLPAEYRRALQGVVEAEAGRLGLDASR